MDLPSGSNTVVTEPTSKYFGRKTKLFGVEFRSQLEAQWAAFFTLSGIRWGYEMHKVTTTHGGYIPDFYLPDIQGGLICEVKPFGRVGEDKGKTLLKLMDACICLGKNATLLRGSPYQFCVEDIKDLRSGEIDGSHAVYFFNADDKESVGFDSPYHFCVCPHCWKAGYEFDGRGERICRGSCGLSTVMDAHNFDSLSHGDKGYSASHPRIRSAARMAQDVVWSETR